MDIKCKYRLYCRVAIGISIIVSVLMMLEIKDTTEVNPAILFFGAFSFCTHLLFVIIGHKKEKYINKKFGFIKVEGNRWLGYDGFWHDGYDEVYAKKLEQYYKNDGADLGYRPTLFMNGFSIVIGGIGGLGLLSGQFPAANQEDFLVLVVGLGVILLYAILRRAVFG